MKKILIIEDEKPLYEVIKKMLDRNGFDAIAVRSMDMAMDVLRSGQKIDLIWLDHLILGPQTGLDFVGAIKRDAVFSKIPVFVVSNSASQDQEKKYIRLGVKRYYVKSNHTLAEIIADIKSFLKVRPATQL